MQESDQSPASVALQALDLLIDSQCVDMAAPNLLSVAVWRSLQRLLLRSSHATWASSEAEPSADRYAHTSLQHKKSH